MWRLPSVFDELPGVWGGKAGCVARFVDQPPSGERPEHTAQGYRRFRCGNCGKQFNERSTGVLNRAQYPSDVIALVVLWRLRYKLSLRDLAEMFLTRGFIFTMRPFVTGKPSSLQHWLRTCASGEGAKWAEAGTSTRPTSECVVVGGICVVVGGICILRSTAMAPWSM
jgi:hypothetical protein